MRSWQDQHRHQATVGTATAPGATDSRPRRSWLWGIVGIVLIAVKLETLASLAFHHSWTAVVFLAIGAFLAFLHGNLLRAAVWSSPLIAIAIDPHSPLVGVAIAFATYFALVGICLAIGGLLTLGDRE